MKELKASESIKLLERFLVDLFNGYFRSRSFLKRKVLQLKTGFLSACRENGIFCVCLTVLLLR